MVERLGGEGNGTVGVGRGCAGAATDRAVRAGFLRPEDAELLKAAAAAPPPVDPWL